MILLPWYSRGIDFSNQKKKGRFKRIMLDTARLQEFYMDGSRLNDMAREFKVSKATVVRHLKFLIPDFLKKNRGRTGNLKAPFNKEIIKLYTNDHMSTSQIAREMKCSAEKVRKHLLKCGVEMRTIGFKNPLSYHPKRLNRKTGKTYPIDNLEEFNKTFLFLYCMNYPVSGIAGKLNIDRSTAKRRLIFLRKMHHFKIRSCSRCDRIFKFVATKCKRNIRICPVCIAARENSKTRMVPELMALLGIREVEA